jgi:hypothetical protein
MPSDRILLDWVERDLPSRCFTGTDIDDIIWASPVYARHRDHLE